MKTSIEFRRVHGMAENFAIDGEKKNTATRW
jgi:hypothetical protein